MDGHRFDDLTRRIAGRSSRLGSGVLTRRAVLAGVAAGLLGGVTRRGADARQAACGNVICVSNPEVCAAGCVCCVYANGNSRCRPPGSCGPGTITCPAGQSFDRGSQRCVADCAPATCTSLGATCGTFPDGCGGEVACGSCPAPGCSDVSGQATSAACTGAGVCQTTTTSCGLYRCAGNACRTSCASGADCVTGATCQGGVCTTEPPPRVPYGSPCTASSQCQSDVCTAGSCDCPLGERACNGRCIPALACCVDGDCGFDGICRRAACDQTTNVCGVANADSDSRCVSDACATRSCSGGDCVVTPTVECPFCQACSGGVCAATGSDPRCAGECIDGNCRNVPLGGVCTDISQCGLDDSNPLVRCASNGDDSDGTNCCNLGRGFCENDRQCCLGRVCVSNECVPPA